MGDLVLFGGAYGGFNTNLNDTWAYENGTWTQLSPATSPPARNAGAMVYDAATHTMVLFGGCCDPSHGDVTYSDTWTFNGTTWTQQHPAHVPDGRDLQSMAYDAAHSQVVMFGGYAGNSYVCSSTSSSLCNDTWTWNGSDWTQQTPSSSPCPREYQVMDYDGGSGNTVMFGGYNTNPLSSGCSSASLGDTWTWDGSNWTKMTPSSSPPSGQMGASAYDAALGKSVATFDVGHNNPMPVWEWDGSNWTALTPATVSPLRSEFAYAYSPEAGGIVLFGGQSDTSPNPSLGDTWLFDGTKWIGAVTLGVSLSGPSSLTADTLNHVYTPGTFTVTATVTNGGPGTATTPEAALSLPTGFTLASTDVATHHLSDLVANGSVQTSWTVVSPVADTVSPGGPSTFTVNVDATNTPSWVGGSYTTTVPPLESPGAPGGVTATAGNGQAIVAWTPPTTGLPIASYQVQAYTPTGVAVGSPVAVDGSLTSTTITGLTSDCTIGRYRFGVSANNTLGPNPGPSSALSSTVIAAGHVSEPPSSIVILLQGLTSSLPSDPTHEGYDPRGYSGCGLRDVYDGKIPNYDEPAFMSQTASSFDPNPQDPAYHGVLASPDLTDLLAANGALMLPFSYLGGGLLGNAGETPALYVNPYGSSEPAHTLRDAAADQLDLEVGSVHRVWPTTPIIIIGHSNGGLVAETLFEKHAGTVSNDNVKYIFSVDSPINGIYDPGALLDWGFNRTGGGAPVLSPQLLEEYHQLWGNRQTRDAQLITQDQQMGNLYIPIGTYNDELYASANSATITVAHSLASGTEAQWHGIDSQVLCTAFTLGEDCQAVSPPDLLVSGNPTTGSVLKHYIPSHSWVFTQQAWVNLLGNSVLPGSSVTALSSARPSTTSTTTTTTPSTTLRPTSGLSSPAASDGATITITGTNLGTAAGQVTFADADGNRIPGSVTLWTASQVQVVVPAAAVTGEVYTTTAAGDESYTGGLTVLDPTNGVQALTVTQTSAATDGIPVSVTVAATGATGLPAAGVPVTPSSGLGTGAPVTTDATGSAVIPVTDWGTSGIVVYSGTAFTSAALSWTPPPPTSITVSTAVGPHVVGATVPVQANVTIGGQPAPAGTQVTFSISGASSASLTATTAQTDSQGNATTSVANSLASAAQITASTANDSATATTSVSWLPTVTGVSPTTGPTSGGTQVTISGNGFVAPSKAYFGGAVATNVTVVNSTTITATSPANSTAGSVDVTVVAPGGQSPTNGADTYAYTTSVPSPTVTSISPASGPAAGGTTVTVKGTGFTSGVTVSFGATVGTNIVVVSATQLTITSPAEVAGAVDVTVTGPGGTSATSAPDQYTFV